MTLDTNQVINRMNHVIDSIIQERFRQIDLYGHQEEKTNGDWLAVFTEELGEIAQAMQQGSPATKETDADDLYEELIQGAAVLTKWAEVVKGYGGSNNG